MAGPPGNFYSPRLSHDGLRVAVDNSGVENNGDIWIYSLSTPAATRFTSDVVDESRPIWSPDDSQLAYCSYGKTVTMFARRVSRPQREATFHVGVEEEDWGPRDWSPDGKYISLHRP